MITGEENIERFRIYTLYHGLKLEMKGIRMNRGRTALSLLRDVGFKGNREKVLHQVEEWLLACK
jgi:succinylarginine dihydrolase